MAQKVCVRVSYEVVMNIILRVCVCCFCQVGSIKLIGGLCELKRIDKAGNYIPRNGIRRERIGTFSYKDRQGVG